MMQAFAYKHLVPVEDLQVSIASRGRFGGQNPPAGKPNSGNSPNFPAAGRRTFQSPVALLDEPPLKIPLGGIVELRVAMPMNFIRGDLQVELSDPPEGIALDKVSRFDKGVMIVLRGDAEKAQPGLKGNLIANAFQKMTFTDKEGKSRETRSPLGTLPAIPFEIVKP
jgi:hypothetical protein